MRTLLACFKLLFVAAVTMIVVYLLSLPFFYFSLTWENGTHSVMLEDIFLGSLTAAGFFGFRWFDRIFRDDGSGDLYLWSAMVIITAILFAFRSNSSYAVDLGSRLYRDGVKYKNMLVFDGGTLWGNLTDLMKFSSVYIITYAAAFCFLLAMFGRSLWNQRMPAYLKKLKLDFYEWSDRIKDSDIKNDGPSGRSEKEERMHSSFHYEWYPDCGTEDLTAEERSSVGEEEAGNDKKDWSKKLF